MHKIKLVTDSTCDLSQQLIKEHDIAVVPLYVIFPGEEYRDNVDLTTPKMYELVREKGILPKTAAASPGDIQAVFERYLQEGYQILFTGIGNNFSATMKSALAAKTAIGSEDIYLVDSQNLSSGSGLLLLKAVKFRAEGLSAAAIKERIEALAPKVRSQFVIDTLEYLHKGGRLNAFAAAMGTMLKIKPIIKVRDGVLGVGKKGRGTVRVGVDIMLQEAFAEKHEIDGDCLMITHSLAHADAKYVRDQIRQNLKIDNVYETDAGCVISSHCGRGTIGILYLLK